MGKSSRPLPDRSEITDDTPLHLETAARLAFPDGVVSGHMLRSAAHRGNLEYERLGIRIVTTLRWIREWRERNRHPAEPRTTRDRPAHLDDQYRSMATRALLRKLEGMRSERNAEARERKAKKPRARKPV